MFEALRERLKDVQDIQDRLLDAAIAVATELRLKVRAGARAATRRRRDLRKELRASGLTAKETRAKVGGPRKTSGVSIEARSTGDAVRLTASDQVQYLRRAQVETPDIVEVFRKHMSIAEKWRARRAI